MPSVFSLIPDSVSKLHLHTGNMLFYSEVTTQVQLMATQQMVESLKLSMAEVRELPPFEGDCINFKLASLPNQTDSDKQNLQTLVKVFITSKNNLGRVEEALQYTIDDLGLDTIDSVMLAYDPKTEEGNVLEDIKYMWKTLEKFVKDERVLRIGISDVEVKILESLYETSEIKPSITQINLMQCCVVPEDLQEFCKKHEIRILTHNDPPDVLPVTELKPVFTTGGEELPSWYPQLRVPWITRFQAHIKCRGILSNRSYIICLEKDKPETE